MLIVDEGHQIKNPSCQSGRSLRRVQSRSRLLLTGQLGKFSIAFLIFSYLFLLFLSYFKSR